MKSCQVVSCDTRLGLILIWSCGVARHGATHRVNRPLANLAFSVTRLGEFSPFGRYFFRKISPKISLKQLQIRATFCLKIPKFWPEISMGKVLIYQGSILGAFFHKTSGHTACFVQRQLLSHENIIIFHIVQV
jgi:hypothetical protein